MMKMLEAGGISPLTDNLRTPDDDNPKGYYEFERVKQLPGDTEWIPEARGKAVKVLAELVKHLPSSENYRIIFIQRELDEIIESQRKMLIRRGEDPDTVSAHELKVLFTKYLGILKGWLNTQSNVRVLYVSYNEILSTPKENIRKIDAFIDNRLNTESMMESIDSSLYRNRSG